MLGTVGSRAHEEVKENSRRIKSTGTEMGLLITTMQKQPYKTRGVGSYPLAKGFLRRNTNVGREQKRGVAINCFSYH